jgi:rSAM/selenodomain-associated transferase 2
MPFLSIIVPVLNEEAMMAASLERLHALRAAGAELIVVDGGSTDSSAELAGPLADQVLRTQRGRAAQMNAGAAAATGDVLLFLHLDSRLPLQAGQLISAAMRDERTGWGHFDIAIEGRHAMFNVIGACMNLRSRMTRVATGDQAIFVRRALFGTVGGYPQIALMEDIALCKALRRHGPPAVIAGKVTTSGRRWEKHGVVRTIVLMWWLRLCYFLGGNPDRLAKAYEHN